MFTAIHVTFYSIGFFIVVIQLLIWNENRLARKKASRNESFLAFQISGQQVDLKEIDEKLDKIINEIFILKTKICVIDTNTKKAGNENINT